MAPSSEVASTHHQEWTKVSRYSASEKTVSATVPEVYDNVLVVLLNPTAVADKMPLVGQTPGVDMREEPNGLTDLELSSCDCFAKGVVRFAGVDTALTTLVLESFEIGASAVALGGSYRAPDRT